MRQLQPSLPMLPSLLGTTGQGGAKQASESRGWRPPTCAPTGFGETEPITHLILECWASLGRRVWGVPSAWGWAPEHFPSLGAHGSWGISFRAVLVAQFTVA